MTQTSLRRFAVDLSFGTLDRKRRIARVRRPRNIRARRVALRTDQTTAIR